MKPYLQTAITILLCVLGIALNAQSEILLPELKTSAECQECLKECTDVDCKLDCHTFPMGNPPCKYKATS